MLNQFYATVGRSAVYFAAGAVAGALLVLRLTTVPATDPAAASVLRAQGFVPKVGRPAVPDLPPGARATSTVSGRVRWLPRPAAAPGPCALDALSLDVSCRVEEVEAGAPYARLFAAARLAGPGGAVRMFPETAAGETPSRAPAPAGAPGNLPGDAAVYLPVPGIGGGTDFAGARPAAPRFELALLVGASWSRGAPAGVELGAEAGRGKNGAYGLVERAADGSRRVHGGYRRVW